jgi:hypothetical protein
MANKAVAIFLGLALAGGLTYALTRKAKAANPNIILQNLTTTPSELFPGETVAIGVEAYNNGDVTGSTVVTCEISLHALPLKTLTKTVSLQPGETKTITFTFTPALYGPYGVAVDGLTGFFTVSEPTPAPHPNIYLQSLTIRPSEPVPSESVQIGVDAFNIGDAAGSTVVTCEITLAGSVLKTMTQIVSLQPGEAKPLTFTFTPKLYGTYGVTVDGLTGFFTVPEPPPAPAQGTVTFSLINPEPAPRWGLGVSVSNDGTSIYFGSPKKAPIGQTISYNWDDIVAWAGQSPGWKLQLEFSLRDESDYFIGRVYYVDGSLIIMSHNAYAFDYSTKELLYSG